MKSLTVNAIAVFLILGTVQSNHAQGQEKGKPCYLGSCDEVCFFGEDCRNPPKSKSPDKPQKPKVPTLPKFSVNGFGPIQFGMNKQQLIDIYGHRVSFETEGTGLVALDTDDGPFGLKISFDDNKLVTSLSLFTYVRLAIDYKPSIGERVTQTKEGGLAICNNLFSTIKNKLFDKYGKPTRDLSQGYWEKLYAHYPSLYLLSFKKNYDYKFPDGSNIELEENYAEYPRSSRFVSCGVITNLSLSSKKDKDNYQVK